MAAAGAALDVRPPEGPAFAFGRRVGGVGGLYSLPGGSVEGPAGGRSEGSGSSGAVGDALAAEGVGSEDLGQRAGVAEGLERPRDGQPANPTVDGGDVASLRGRLQLTVRLAEHPDFPRELTLANVEPWRDVPVSWETLGRLERGTQSWRPRRQPRRPPSQARCRTANPAGKLPLPPLGWRP